MQNILNGSNLYTNKMRGFNKAKWPNKNYLLLIFCAILALVFILYQLLSKDTFSRGETMLLSVLQFVFSIIFAWTLSDIVSKKEFEYSQKKFATSAFRRIKEIEKGIDRLISRAQSKIKEMPSSSTNELDVILATAIGIKETTKSSAGDWADIIGTEISTFEKIETLEKTENTIDGEGISESDIAGIKSSVEETKIQIKNLISTLPPQLQLLAGQKTDRDTLINEKVSLLRKEYKRKGFVELTGFWDEAFERNVRELAIGEKLLISLDDTPGRTGAFIAKDGKGKSVGVITNRLSPLRYEEFITAIEYYLDKSKFSVELIKNDETIRFKDGTERHYFVVKILDVPAT